MPKSHGSAVRAEAPRFSECEFGVAIHGLDDGLGDLFLGAKPVEDQVTVAAQGSGDGLERGQPRVVTI